MLQVSCATSRLTGMGSDWLMLKEVFVLQVGEIQAFA